VKIAPDFVGLVHLSDALANLKKLLLIFDRLAINGMEDAKSVVKYVRQGIDDTLLAGCADLVWLADKGIIFEPPRLPFPDEITEYENLGKIDPRVYALFNELTTPPVHFPSCDDLRYLEERCQYQIHWYDTVGAAGYLLGMRLHCAYMRHVHSFDVVPLRLNTLDRSEQLPAGKENVVRILVPGLPEPDDGTSLEQILDFRADPDAISAFRRFRNWMSRFGKGTLDVIETQEELEYLLDEYERYMKLHRMKTRKTLLESIVVSTADMTENILKLKWSAAAKVLFTADTARVDLLEAELKAPGRELAYLSMLNKKFNHS
jgi:hypothetical protein